MKSTIKIIVIAISITSVMLLTGILFLWNYNINYVLNQENVITNKSINSIEQYFDSSQLKYRGIVLDWGHWDSTYDFIESGNQNYINDNLNDVTFQNLDINFMIFYDLNNNIIYQSYYDLDTNAFESFPKDLNISVSQFADSSDFIEPGTVIVHVDSEFFIITAVNILDSYTQKNANGVLLIGRKIDSSIIEVLEEATISNINILTTDQVDQSIAQSLQQNSSNQRYINIQNNNTISAYYLPNNKMIPSNAVIVMTTNRDFYSSELSRIYFLIGLFVLSVIIITSFIIIFVHKYSIKPIIKISDQIKRFNLLDLTSNKIQIDNNHEFSVLAKTINSMLDEIETERKQNNIMKDRLIEAQQIANIGNWEIDLETKIVWASKHALKIYGFNQDSPYLQLKQVQLSVIDEDRPRMDQALKNTIENNAKYDEIFKVKNAENGMIKVIHSLAKLEYDQNGKPTKINGTIQDITLRIEIEEKLKERETRFHSLFENMTSAAIIYEVLNDGLSGDDYIVKEYNAAAYKYEEISNLRGKSISEIRPNINEFGILPILENVWKTGSSADFCGKYTNQNSHKWYENHIFKLESGEIVCIYDDVTEKIMMDQELQKSEQKYRMIAENTADVIWILNLDLQFTFVSPSIEKLLGYNTDEFLALRLNQFIPVFHLNNLLQRFKNEMNNANFINDQVWTIEFEEIRKDGQVIWTGNTIRFMCDDDNRPMSIIGLTRDISEQKNRESEILYLGYHDILTGLYNRAFYDKEKDRLEKENNLPTSIIIGDINGLKLINDALGHDHGDRYLKEIAKILQNCCRDHDILARTGGDEFIILLPQTDSETAYQILKLIQQHCCEYNEQAINETYYVNISLGYATKEKSSQDIDSIIKLAEDQMYKHKLLEHKSLHSHIIASMKLTLAERSKETEKHAERLISLSKAIGKRLKLTDEQLNELELFATLHDIGKIGIDDQVLNKPDKLTEQEWVEMKKHSQTGYRIAVATNDLIPIAEYILYHHEHWDGTGYPEGLKGEQIPLLSRIIAVVDAYDAMTQDRSYREALSKEYALNELLENSGTQFDPVIVKIFLDIINNSDIE